MLSRMARHSDAAAMCARFSVRARPPSAPPPTWNLAAGMIAPVVQRFPRKRRELALMRWGLEIDHHLLGGTMDAAVVPAAAIYRAALLESLFLSNRCIVPVDAFYVGPAAWARGGRPWAFAMEDGAMIGIAGIWTGDGFALISTSPNESVALMDDHMPAILFPEDEREWLDHGTGFYDAFNLLKPFPAELMRAWPVSQAGADGPDLLRRVA